MSLQKEFTVNQQVWCDTCTNVIVTIEDSQDYGYSVCPNCDLKGHLISLPLSEMNELVRQSIYDECGHDCSDNGSCYDCQESIDCHDAWR